jgi:hypothetical protein
MIVIRQVPGTSGYDDYQENKNKPEYELFGLVFAFARHEKYYSFYA